MALVLALRPGEDFTVGDKLVGVGEVFDGSEFNLHLYETNETVLVTEDEEVEIYPDVWVSAGGRFRKGQVQVVIDAPRNVQIMSESKGKKCTTVH